MAEENEEEETMSRMVETETRGFRPQKEKPRKPLTKTQENMYNKQLEKAPDSYVFIKNGTYYDIFGDKAEELSKKYNKEIITENDKSVEPKPEVV